MVSEQLEVSQLHMYNFSSPEICFHYLHCNAPCVVFRYCILVQQKEKWEKQEGQGQKEKEELNQEVQKSHLLQQENLQLKTEVDR